MSDGPGTFLRIQPRSVRILCEQSILIFFMVFEFLYVHVYTMHWGQCINKGERIIVSLIHNPF